MTELTLTRLSKKKVLHSTRSTVIPLMMLFGAVVIIGLPLLMAVLWSLVDPDFPWSYPDIFPTQLSLFHWNYVFRFTDITKAIITSYTIAPLATILAFILSLPPSYAIATMISRAKRSSALSSCCLSFYRVWSWLCFSAGYFNSLVYHKAC
jgi:putative spermidine/putrescine transport system permease protein